MSKLNLSLTQPITPFFERFGTKIIYKPNQSFDRPEDSMQGVYLMIAGQALIYTVKSDGISQIIGMYEEGAVFARPGGLINQPQIYQHLEALTNCVVYRMPLDVFQTIYTTNKEFLGIYIKQIALMNMYIVERVITLGENDALKRIVRWLLFMEKYYGDTKGNQSTLRISLTQEQIASFTSLTRESVNKYLQLLKRKKQIKIQKGKISINNLEALRDQIDILNTNP